MIITRRIKCWQSRNDKMMTKEESSTVNGAINIVFFPHNQGVVNLVCQNTIADMKEYNVKRRSTTKHSSHFGEFLGQA